MPDDADVTSSGIEPGPGVRLVTIGEPLIALNDSRVTSLTSGAPLGSFGEARLLGDVTVVSTASLVAASSTVEITGTRTLDACFRERRVRLDARLLPGSAPGWRG